VADISRDELATIIQEEYSNELLAAATSSSAALTAFRKVDMGTKTINLPVSRPSPKPTSSESPQRKTPARSPRRSRPGATRCSRPRKSP
jgi:hypothetical protein